MPPKAADLTTDEAAAAASETASRISTEAQRAITEASRKIEAAVQEGLQQLRAQSRVYADAAGEQLDEAARLASDQIRARPLAAAGAALGIGVVIGLLLAAQRR